MEKVAILGAGAMGSALVTPLVHNGHDVRLWGTELDDGYLEAIRAGKPHPRLGLVSGAGARLFASHQLADALDGATLAVLAVTSTAALSVFAHVLPALGAGVPVAIVSKGFADDGVGPVRLFPEALAGLSGDGRPFVGIGGPCKANEVAAGWPTVAVFGALDGALRERCAAAFGTDLYVVVVTDDLTGLELAAATKNAYAIALGACDGLALREGHPWHNLKAALFAQAIGEMRLLARALGGRDDTIIGPAGVGDLEVTGLSGRNRALGELIGQGTPGDQAIAMMEQSGQTVEGPAAARAAWRLVSQLEGQGSKAQAAAYPLLAALVALLAGQGDPATVLASLLVSSRRAGLAGSA